MSKNLRERISESPAAYLLTAILLTWVGWWPAVFVSRSNVELARLLQVVGGIGLVAATGIFLSLSSAGFRRSYLQRLVRGRFGPWWWLAALALPIVITAGAVWLDLRLGNGIAFTPLLNRMANPKALIVSGFFLLFFGPLPEEISWRGYGLPRLRSRTGPLVSSILLGFVWTVWHLPLFWLKDSYQAKLGVMTPRFWLYMLAAFCATFIYTWIWEGTQSTLAAVGFHFMANFAGELFDPSHRADFMRTLVYLGIAGAISVYWFFCKPGRSDRKVF